jgi:hypothetical protein
MQGASAVVSYTAAASQYIAVDPALWRGVNMLKVRSGTSGCGQSDDGRHRSRADARDSSAAVIAWALAR